MFYLFVASRDLRADVVAKMLVDLDFASAVSSESHGNVVFALVSASTESDIWRVYDILSAAFGGDVGLFVDSADVAVSRGSLALRDSVSRVVWSAAISPAFSERLLEYIQFSFSDAETDGDWFLSLGVDELFSDVSGIIYHNLDKGV